MLSYLTLLRLSLRHRVYPGSRLCSHALFDASSSVRGLSSLTTPVGSSFFANKETLYDGETSDIEQISQFLEHHRFHKWGFVIYRCTYKDDFAWAHFMDRMNEQRDALLTWEYGIGDPDDEMTKDVARRLDWRMQEDPMTLNGASKDEVRHKFRRLVTTSLEREESDENAVSVAARSENPRWNFCVHVDQASLDSVCQGVTDEASEGEDDTDYVSLIRADDSWEVPDYDRFDWSSHTSPGPDEDDEHDEGEEEIEGSRGRDVGWMKVRVSELVPTMYTILMKAHLWDAFYVRPPEVSRP